MSKIYAIDFETSTLQPCSEQDILAVSMWAHNEHWYFEDIADIVGWLEEHQGDVLVAHNAKFDISKIVKGVFGFDFVFEDTMIAGWLLNENIGNSLDKMAKHYLNEGKVGKAKDFQKMTVKEQEAYCVQDSRLSFLLWEVFKPKLKKEKALWDWYNNVEKPLICVLAKMEKRGIRVDRKEAERQKDVLTDIVENTEESLYTIAKGVFNPRSGKQLGKVLKELGCTLGYTAKGNPQTDKDSLNWYYMEGKKKGNQALIEFINKLLKFKKAQKLLSTYIFTGCDKIFPSFNSIGTVTGRFSSSSPNFQNMPREAFEGVNIRKVFISQPGHLFLDYDYSQMELRILAHYSGDENLQKVIIESDAHSATAMMMFNLDCEVNEVKTKYPEMRQWAKTLNFGLMYGMSYKSLAEMLEISEKKGGELYEMYFNQFPKVKLWVDRIQHWVKKFGWIRTIGGRYRRLPGAKSNDWGERGYALRQAVNSIIQGSNGDIIKKAMLRLDRELPEGVYLLGQIHDELLIEVDLRKIQEVKRIVKNVMENEILGLTVPVKVNGGVARNWAEAKS